MQHITIRACRRGEIHLHPSCFTTMDGAFFRISGKAGLQNCRHGVVLTVYETDLGQALWATCESAVQLISAGSVDLIMTSPPYPLTQKKQYGNLDTREHVEWLAGCARDWRRILADTGSLVLNLADVWTPGAPAVSLYQERLLIKLIDELGYHLAQKFYWENPAKMPSPAEWVTVRRIRVTNSIENIWWLAKTPHPKANNREVLRPYFSPKPTDGLCLTWHLRHRCPHGLEHAQATAGEDGGRTVR